MHSSQVSLICLPHSSGRLLHIHAAVWMELWPKRHVHATGRKKTWPVLKQCN